MITKTYNINITLAVNTYSGSVYNRDTTGDGIDNFKYISTLTDGNYDEDTIVIDGKLVSIRNNGHTILMDSYVKKDGKEFYSIQSNDELIDTAYIYERYNNAISIRDKFAITTDGLSFIKNQLISNLNLLGIKSQLCTHSEISTFISSINPLDENFEIIKPITLNSTSIAIKTRFFPILPIFKIYGYVNTTSSYLDVSDNIISVSQHTGEIEIETSDIDHVKIIYFIAPAIIKKQINDILINDEQYINIEPYAETIYTDIVSENENMLLDTLEASDCTIFPINKIEGIELSKNMIINGRISKTSNDYDVYNISPSYNIYDNLIQTTLDFNLPNVDNNINIAILGLFENTHNRLTTMSIGVDAIPLSYQNILTSLSTYNTILHNTNSPIPSANNGQLTYSIDHTINDGYGIILPAWADISTLVINKNDGVSISPFLNYTFIEPDIVILDKDYTSKDDTYNIQFTSYVSPIISIIDSYNHKAYISSVGNLFTQYPTLQKIYLLCKDTVSVMYINKQNTYEKIYFKNKSNLTIDVSKEYIKTNLDKYKSLILEI